jgi:phosphotransferase family enzyme
MPQSVVDLASVKDFLRGACDRDVPLDDLEMSYVQAGPDGPVRALYEGPGRRGGVLRLTARRVKADKGRQLEVAINAKASAAVAGTGFDRAAIYAPSLAVLFQVFPCDDRLPSLVVAVDESRMAAVLEEALASQAGGARLGSVSARVMRYKPERKCLIRYELAWAEAAPDAPQVVWARTARASKFERSRNTLPRIHAARGGLGFELPQPLGVVPDLAMELFGPVSGAVIFADVQRRDYPQISARTGEALRRFHALPVTVDDTFGVADQVGRLEENAVEFGWMLPDAAGRIERAAAEIAARLRALPASPPRLIHRDFHGDNVLVAGDGGLVLLDFEDCAMGEPADDVASQWAQLTWHVHRAAGARALPEAGRRAFMESYARDADPATLGCLPAYAAMHAFLYAHQCLRHPLDAGRFDDARAMLAECERLLERGWRE